MSIVSICFCSCGSNPVHLKSPFIQLQRWCVSNRTVKGLILLCKASGAGQVAENGDVGVF